MTREHRTDLLEAIAELSQRYPEWRFGQLIANVADWADQGVWDVENDQLFSAAKAHLMQASGSHASSR